MSRRSEVVRCDACNVGLDAAARFCPRCGLPLVDGVADAAATTAWSRPGSEVVDLDDLNPPRPGRGRIWLMATVAVLCAGMLALVTLIVVGSTNTSRRPSRDEPPIPMAAVPPRTAREPVAATSDPPSQHVAEERWWTPPRGKRESVDALAYAFAGIDERDLGRVFDADLEPVYGAPSLFEEHEPRRVRRNEMFHSLIALRDTMQLKTGFSFLFLQFGTTRDVNHDYQLYRALDVVEVASVDEAKRMREPPREAVFYLAEVHRGTAYDMLIEGDMEVMGAQLGLALAEGGASAGSLQQSGRYRITQRGLGLRPLSGDAIFAMTREDVASRYVAVEDPVAVKLVFRTIPGRRFERTEISVPKAAIDQRLDLSEGAEQRWRMNSSGTFRLIVRSRPDGVKVRWSGAAWCDPEIESSAYYSVETTCSVGVGDIITVENPTTLGAGPTEHGSIYLATTAEANPYREDFSDQDPEW